MQLSHIFWKLLYIQDDLVNVKTTNIFVALYGHNFRGTEQGLQLTSPKGH